MKLTRASSYALHAVTFMAAEKTDKPIASHHIAAARKIPERFLLKVLKPLVGARVLMSIKGPNGGYKLAKPPTQITMLDIIEAVDGTLRGHAPANEKNPNDPLDSKLETICNQNAEQIRKHLEKVRISELVGGKTAADRKTR
jgi:Rrf2 family protein